MIEILPMEEKDREARILGGLEVKAAGARVLAMTEGEELLGWVAVDIVKGSLRMLRFEITAPASAMEQTFYLDTLMRSAASYGETKGAHKLETVTPEWNGFLKKRGFDTDESHAFAPMSLIVRYE